MTDKELHKLGRRELLQLLLQQGREAEEQRQQLTETEEQLRQLEENYERLRKRLDQKDEQIHQLRDMLEAERTKREIKLEKAGSIAEAALRLNGIFEAAQSAADQYLHNVRLLKNGESREHSKKRQEIYDIQAEVVPVTETPVAEDTKEAAAAVAEAPEEPRTAVPAVGEPLATVPAAGEPLAVAPAEGEPLAAVPIAGEQVDVVEEPAKPLLATEMYRIQKREEIAEPEEKAVLLKRQQGWRMVSQRTPKPAEMEKGIFHSQAGLRKASF